jgi:eukaryotic-like serine/threonine-protein kinase
LTRSLISSTVEAADREEGYESEECEMSDQQEAYLGQQVGEYRLMYKLGGGSFGTVYLAEHVYEHTRAAVKVLAVPVTKSEDFKDFINEARMIKLHHPHIVPLLNFGTSGDDLPFLVMEYASGGTLRDRHPKGERVPLSTIVSYVDQLASALQYAHDHRVIHRDVKPENILVRADGTLLVSDFGVAKFLEQSVLISQQTQVGTPMYVAPEQHMGYPCFASDQYALAVVVYEWICGVRPFQGTALGLALQHMNTPPPRLRGYLPGLSEEVERVVLKALAKVPEDRFESIQKFADALHQAVQSLPSMVVLGQLIETRKTVPFIPSGQVSQLASGLLHNRAAPSAPNPRSGRRFSWLVRGGLVLLIVLIIPLITTGSIASVQRGSSSTPVTPKHPNQMVQQKWTFSTGGELYAVSSPMAVDGMLYVSSGDDKVNKVYAVDADTGQQKWAFPTTGSLTVINGVLYIVSDDHKVYAVDAHTGQQKWAVLTDNSLSYSSPIIVNGVLYVASGSNVYAIEADTGQEKWVYPAHSVSQTAINDVLYVASYDRVHAIDSNTGQEKWVYPAVEVLPSQPTTVESMVVNGVLYVASENNMRRGGKVYAIDASTGQEKWTFTAKDSIASSPIVINGVLYVASSSKVYAIDVSTGQQRWAFLTGGPVFSAPTVVNGVLYVGSTDENMHAIDASTGQEKWAFSTGAFVNSSPTVANGIVYFGANNGKVYAVDASTGQQKWTFPTANWVDLSPTVVNGMLYVGSHDGKIYALTLPVSSS